MVLVIVTVIVRATRSVHVGHMIMSMIVNVIVNVIVIAFGVLFRHAREAIP